MRSSTGRWVSGGDFFNRERELQILETRVRDRNHVLLTGQRRMGKTSIARELGQRLEAEGWVFLFADVEGATCAEDAIADIARAVHPVRSISSRFASGMKRWLSDNIEEISAYEFRAKFRADLNAGNWRHQGEQLLRACAEQDKPVLLVIDELPIFLKRVLRGENGVQRTDEFLSWLRGMLQALGDNSPVLIVSGSIGQSGSAYPTASIISIPFAWGRGTVIPVSSVFNVSRRVAACESRTTWQTRCTMHSASVSPTMCSPSSHGCGTTPPCRNGTG